MTSKPIVRPLSAILCIMLIASTALFATGFGDKPTGRTNSPTELTSPILPAPTEATVLPEITVSPLPEAAPDVTVKGEGKYWFYLNVTDLDETLTKFLIQTDKETVYDALAELNLITGNPFYNQLDITSVNGISVNPDVECTYWKFYINGKYSVIHIGKQATKIIPGATYAFKKQVSYIDKGNGSTAFYLDVLQTNNTIKKYRIRTDKETLGEALKPFGLIHALPDQDGWFITSVDAIGGCYWDLYINGTYACTDTDMYDARIIPGSTYRFAKKEYLDAGEGANSFCLEVVSGELFGHPESTLVKRRIHTDKPTVGEALQEMGWISFDAEGRISTIDGYRVNWEAYHTYFEFAMDGEPVRTHVNDTPITKDAVYIFTKEHHQTVLGSGSTTFYLSVNYITDKSRTFQINTDKQTLWEALVEVGLITVDSDENGRFVTSVNGLSAEDGHHWEFRLVCTDTNVLFSDAPVNGNQYIFYQTHN